MSDKFYTNIILTVIAVLLAGILLKGFVNSPIETKVFAGDEKYKEFRLATTYNYGFEETMQSYVKTGWKPISIAQSQKENQSSAELTILFAK